MESILSEIWPTRYVNAVYYTSWAGYDGQGPSSLPVDYISHIYYAFARVSADGVILVDTYLAEQIEVDGAYGCLRACLRLKQYNPKLKVILSIHDEVENGTSFAQVARCPAKRAIFAQNAIEVIRRYRLNGIDIDWEHPLTPEQGNDYILLLLAIRRLVSPHSYILTSALPAGTWALQYIDISLADSLLDFINLMTYDLSGPWTSTTGHHAQLYTPSNPHNDAARTSCASAVQYLIENNFPSKKILLGIPAYGRSFPGANDVGQKYDGHGAVYRYRELPLPGSVEHVDEKVGAAYSVGGDGGFVSYDNPRTVRMKAEFVKENGLGGLFYWHGSGDKLGKESLIREGYNGLHSLEHD